MREKPNMVISVHKLHKAFDGFTAVNEIDFEVSQGEIFGFLGPNGSGKTTTIRMMLGLLKPTSGQVDVLGLNVAERARDILPRVGYMSQKFSLYNDLTVLQNLKFYGQSYGLEPSLLQERIADTLQMADLEGHEHTDTRDLSGGWRQRLALGAAILHRPEILFLDEPTAGVDPISRRAFWDLLYRYVEEGKTIFITTHYMDEAEHCHRLALLQRGDIIAIGSPESIKEDQLSGQVLEIEAENINRAIRILQDAQSGGELSLTEIELYGNLIHALTSRVRPDQRAIRRLFRQNKIQLHRIDLIEPSLEDVFIASMNNNQPGEIS